MNETTALPTFSGPSCEFSIDVIIDSLSVGQLINFWKVVDWMCSDHLVITFEISRSNRTSHPRKHFVTDGVKWKHAIKNVWWHLKELNHCQDFRLEDEASELSTRIFTAIHKILPAVKDSVRKGQHWWNGELKA